MSRTPKSPADQVEFFRLLQHVMQCCPDRQKVEALHRAAQSSPTLRLPYDEGAWAFFGDVEKGRGR